MKKKHSPQEAARASALILAAVIAAQMLPATMLSPAIRPLFANMHGGSESPMHAFMALNMLGGILMAPLVAKWGDRLRHPLRLAAALSALDALILACMILPLPTSTVLALRLLEGAAHVSASTLLLAEAASYRKVLGNGQAMGLAGAGIMAAVAAGSALGGQLLRFGVPAPFLAGALVSLMVAVYLAARPTAERGRAEKAAGAECSPWQLAAPISAAFVERFAVGCIVVSFSLFAHRGHALSDSAIGNLFAAFTVPFALLMYPVGRLADRVPAALLLGGGGLVYATALFSLGHVSRDGLWLSMSIAGTASALMFSPTLSYAAALAGPAGRSRAMSWVTAAGCLGMLLGPSAAGVTSVFFADAADPLARYRAVFNLSAATVGLWTLAASAWLCGRLRIEQREIASRRHSPRNAPAGSHRAGLELDASPTPL